MICYLKLVTPVAYIVVKSSKFLGTFYLHDKYY